MSEEPIAEASALSAKNVAVACLLLGVLSLVGYAGYRRMRAAGQAVEARRMIGSTRLSEEASRAEHGHYFSVNRDLSELCPSRPIGAQLAWRPSCGSGVDGPWSKFNIAPTEAAGDVGIAVVAAAGGSPTMIEVAGQSFPPTALPADWYAIYSESMEVDWWTGRMKRTRFLSTSLAKKTWLEAE